MNHLRLFNASCVSLAFMYSTNAISNDCSEYRNKIVSPISFSQAYDSLRTISPRGEFESRDDYNNRIKSYLIPNEILISKKAEKNKNNNFIYYNVDEQVLGIKKFSFNNSNVGIWMSSYKSNPNVNIDMMSQNYSVINIIKTDSSIYSASNAFGSIIDVKETDYNVDVLVDPRKLHFMKSGLFPNYRDNEYLGSIRVNSIDARKIKSAGNLAFVVKPVFPYKSVSSWTFPEATLDKPYTNNYKGRLIVIHFKCGLWLDENNKVIEAFSSE